MKRMALKASNGSTRSSAAIAVLSFLATVGGCSSIRVETRYDPNIDFKTYTNFGWLPVPKARTGGLRIDHAALDAVVRAAVNRKLAARGFKSTTDLEVDFWVVYHVAIRKKLEYSTLPIGYDYSPAWGRGQWTDETLGNRGTYVRTFDEGTLVLDIVDARTSRLAWRGSAKAEVDAARSRRQKEARLKRAVGKMLDGFPPK